ncbi:phosphotransferase enzyme family protein [Rhizobium paknamense]|uniref:Ser/Thr protein kinase RdoA (MazF antagonist) n=1 Tax=Rhizobium paknamense TaxID=1206817 RepID=A0ABU0IJJ1_9HYPH|nr:phosphotransferase [Rhizobium paknamense]MDQ0458428.1 Ser/Thr protein kinase RdoA (MazF antagonist) [Rhizobium paknamense]
MMDNTDFLRLLQGRAADALAHWGLEGTETRLIKYRENAVFRVRLADGASAALRLHRPGYHTRDTILSELRLVAHLVGEGTRAPAPLPTRSGALLAECGSQRAPEYASLVGWMDGVPLGESGRLLDHAPAQAEALFYHLGESLARLHDSADRFVADTNFTRPSWDRDGLLGEAPLWGRFWDCHCVSDEIRPALNRLRETLLSRLANARTDGLDYGLIHADGVRENVMVDGDRIGLIDFDDCGYGYRLFDLATVLLRNRIEPNYAALEAALIAGYRSCRHLPGEAETLLPLFIVLRSLTYIGWAAARPEMAHKAQKYAEDALELAGRLGELP